MMMVMVMVMMMMTIAHLYINLIERPSVDLTVHLTWRFNSLKFARHSDWSVWVPLAPTVSQLTLCWHSALVSSGNSVWRTASNISSSIFNQTYQGKLWFIQPRFSWSSFQLGMDALWMTEYQIEQIESIYWEYKAFKCWWLKDTSLRCVDTLASYGRRLCPMGESSCIKWNKCCGNSEAKALERRYGL